METGLEKKKTKRESTMQSAKVCLFNSAMVDYVYVPGNETGQNCIRNKITFFHCNNCLWDIIEFSVM